MKQLRATLFIYQLDFYPAQYPRGSDPTFIGFSSCHFSKKFRSAYIPLPHPPHTFFLFTYLFYSTYYRTPHKRLCYANYVLFFAKNVRQVRLRIMHWPKVTQSAGTRVKDLNVCLCCQNPTWNTWIIKQHWLEGNIFSLCLFGIY